MAGSALQTGYETKVIAEAIGRAGGNPNLHGHIHEILLRDRLNASAGALLRGESARLTRNTTARAVDVVVMRGGKVARRLQVKDTAAGVAKTLRQVRAGQYRSVKLLGSTETAEAWAKTGHPKVMRSTGISSEYTKSLALRGGAGSAGRLGSACLRSARVGGVAGAAFCGGFAIVKGGLDLYRGQADISDVAVTVGRETAGGALSGAAGSAAGAAKAVWDWAWS